MLYHASKVGGIQVLFPKKHPALPTPVVFATSDQNYALAMTYGSGDMLAVSYGIEKETGKRKLYIDEIKKGTLSLLKKKASLYSLKNEEFEQNSKFKKEEFIAYTEQTVLGEHKIENVYEELQRRGVKLIPYAEVLHSLESRGKDPLNVFIKNKQNRFGTIKG